MKSACLILLALAVCDLNVNQGQKILGEEEDGGALRRAESLLLRSILKEMGDADTDHDQAFLQEWISKRQHPGKRYEDDIEKRQHPGKREEEEDMDYSDLQKRQHPGKREDGVELQRRQHPGKRSVLELLTDSPSAQVPYVGDLSKRQHPGKRYLVYNKRQHPGRRELEDEVDTAIDQVEVEKRQHPGKRYWENTDPNLGPDNPCDVQDPTGCSKAMVLLEMLDNVSRNRAEEKRQHPGRRDARETFTLEDLTEKE
ncbi:prothyroliberin precursor-like [Scleropages formosus]|uniref:Pro-thyrotropin-releasing hormone n=1 Tax=Scleropages formosus TaxID=113540 RepID=A0A0P7X5Y1_SCLFO|nr:prothyroliberin precursor-like [Scleropages formosus]